jgi:hypothetical protein
LKSNLKKPTCAFKRDVLELAILRYLSCTISNCILKILKIDIDSATSSP